MSALLTLALPLVLAQLTQHSLSFVDTLMVGRLGNEALAGIALGSTFFSLVTIVLSGTLYAVSPLVAQAHGAGEPEQAARALRQGLWLAALLFVPALFLFWQAEALLLLMGQAPETSAASGAYLRAIAWGLLPALGITALRGFLEGLGITRPIMLISFVGLGLNMLFNNALMFGRWGFPALGLVGTGYASTFVYSAMFSVMALYVAKRFGTYRPFGGLRTPDPEKLLELLRVGVPIGLTLGFEGGMFGASAFLMGLLGPEQLAAHQIALQSASITFMIPVGLSIATTVRVGQALGRGDPVAARRAGYVGTAASVLMTAFSGLLFWLAPRFVIGLYLDLSDPANASVVALASSFFAVAAMFQLFDGLQVSSAAALRGLKDTRLPMLITLVAYWFVGIGSGAYLCFGLGVGGRGLWFGLVLGLATAGALLAWRFHTKTAALIAVFRAGVRAEA